MNCSRTAFLEAANQAADLLGRVEVAQCWNEMSVLAEFSVAGLAGHLFRAIQSVATYLDQPTPSGTPLSAAEYYHALPLTPVLSSPLNRDVRSRGEQTATHGSTTLAANARTTLEHLSERLVTEAPDRTIQVLDGLAITLDEYLRTRVVELVVHSDDLALSVNITDLVALNTTTSEVAIDVLVTLARLRHGDLLVVRALTRRERDVDEVLRVL